MRVIPDARLSKRFRAPPGPFDHFVEPAARRQRARRHVAKLREHGNRWTQKNFRHCAIRRPNFAFRAGLVIAYSPHDAAQCT
jgi:hypothetical protein